MSAAYCAVRLAVTYQEIPFRSPRVAGIKMERKTENRKEASKKPSRIKEIIKVEERMAPATKSEGQRRTTLAPYDYVDPWRDFDRTFERFRTDLDVPFWSMRPFSRIQFPRMFSTWETAPRVDLEDRGKDYLLTAELPGFKKEDIDLEITRDGVEIKAERSWKKDVEKKNYVHKERGNRSFYRSVRLPEEVKTDKSEATLKDGELEVVLPKKAPKPKKKLTVK
jgi:HSP20 family protein